MVSVFISLGMPAVPPFSVKYFCVGCVCACELSLVYTLDAGSLAGEEP